MLIFLAAVATIAVVGIIALVALLFVLIHTQPTETEEPTPPDLLYLPDAPSTHGTSLSIDRIWGVMCEAGPEFHGVAPTRAVAREMKALLDMDEPDHRHVAMRFYPWVMTPADEVVAAQARKTDNRSPLEVS